MPTKHIIGELMYVIWTNNQEYGIKMYDTRKCTEPIIEFPPVKAHQSINMNNSHLGVGLNYNKGILTFLEPYDHTVPATK